MSGKLADPYVASREMPHREPRRLTNRVDQSDRADRADRADRRSFLKCLASDAWTRWPW
ncbi:hypothetical protein OOK29_28670 [Streptomyces phaeochromogenes]|uniref:hypothetical protein n=1 Tax=Streptomyces phaeochromogenes TaxID=1923 RepID=UPI00224F7AAE|nr:hypothetical protein [Streptomyces phaeochromogenes]MCX5602137.1 hypothetical protein [Streptomyces phaeochromogenes]